MDLNGSEMVAVIAQGTTDYFATFSPILIFIVGILIAFGIFSMVLNAIFPSRSNDFDDNIEL